MTASESMWTMTVHAPAPSGAEPLRTEERPIPTPGPRQPLLRVGACGVCRTDLQIVEGDVEAHRLPIVPGHPIVGEVIGVGVGVRDWTIGERAGVTWLAWADGDCRYCRGGNENPVPEWPVHRLGCGRRVRDPRPG